MNFTTENKLDYQVKLEDFEGPLDLLLSLIEKRKFFINDISLSKVSDDYVGTLRELETFPLRDVSGFLLIASTLVLIKSKSLLPALPLTSEEEGDIENLEERLRMYQRVKDLSRHVESLYGSKPIFEAQKKPKRQIVFSPDKKTTLENLFLALDDVLKDLPKEEKKPEAQIKKIIRLEDVMQRLEERVSNALQVSFSEFGSRGGGEDRTTVIVSFIAVLELVKLGTINAQQEGHFSDIAMEPVRLQVPDYNEYNE